MFVLLMLGLLLFGAAFALFARAVGMAQVRTTESVGRIDDYGYGVPMRDAPAVPRRRALDDVASSLGSAVLRRFAGIKEDALRQELVAAGIYRTPPRRFIGYQVLAGTGLAMLALWLTAAGGASFLLSFFAVVFGGLGGFVLPRSVVHRRAASRLEEIDYDLPELIDLLVVTIEAGLGFTASLRLASERLLGPLGDELKLTLQEQQMGLSMREALDNWLDRCDTPAVRSFVRAIVQGETLGISIGQIMRNLALEMRKRRRQRAEERAQKVPVKILFPLVFLVFPAIFVVLLGPALFHLMDSLGGG